MYSVTDDEIAEEFFGSLPSTMWTLIRICMGDIFGDVIGPVVKVHPQMALVFGAFVVTSSWGVLNLIIGIIIQSTDQANADIREKRYQNMRNIQLDGLHRFCEKFYGDIKDGVASAELGESWVHFDELLKDLDFPNGFCMLDVIEMIDRDASGSVVPSKKRSSSMACTT